MLIQLNIYPIINTSLLLSICFIRLLYYTKLKKSTLITFLIYDIMNKNDERIVSMKLSYNIPCNIAQSLNIIGDRWTFLIIHEIFNGRNNSTRLKRH